MATTMTINSDRVFGIATLQGAFITAAGDVSNDFALPATFGDCLLLSWLVVLGALGTPVANPELRGPLAWIVDQTGLAVESLMDMQTPRWNKATGTALFAGGAPDQPALFRQQDFLRIQFASENSVGTPTLQPVIRVRRLRQLGTP